MNQETSIKRPLDNQPFLDAVNSPFWGWNPKTGRYFDKSTGRFLSQRAVELLQKRHINLIVQDISTIGDLLLKGQINLQTFQEATAKSMKTLHLHQMLLARGGVKHATPEDYLAVGREVRNQYAYLRQFAIDLQRGYSIGEKGNRVPMTEARFRARLQMYAKAGRVSYEIGLQQQAKSQGKYYMRRFLGIAHHCSSCPRYAAMGVQLVGILPLPTHRCECRANCKCYVRYYATPEKGRK